MSDFAPIASNQTVSDLRSLRGIVGTVCLSGTIDPAFAEARENMRAWCIENGYTNVEWRTFNAVLVENGRDEICAHALREGYDWILQVDADAAPIPPDALARILTTAYTVVPDASAVGAYCQLKGGMNVPTIDTGTGTWESHFPGEGVLPCIRTGAHFLLIKTEALHRFGPPWFRTRRTIRPIDALAEVDNYARIKLHGQNPFSASREWGELVSLAKAESGAGPGSVGEDSGFSDALLASGGKLYVDTNLVIGHVERRVIQPSDHIRAMKDRARHLRLACGILE